MERKAPEDLARLWRLPTGSRLGRRAELDVDRIVGTAVDLADRHGTAGATLPKIAAALGVTPMSLYRHIGSKDELVDLMGDAAFGPAPEPGPDLEWRAALRAWALSQSEVFRRHPWLAQLPVSGPPRGPNAIGWMDAGLRALRATELDWPAKIGVITVVGGYVRQAFVLGSQLAESRRAAAVNEAQALRDYSAEVVQLVDPARFPDAAALFASGIFEAMPASADTGDDDFTFGLELVLDGVAAAIMG
ncbi:TetR/AcrR family transcriptional regulator [Nocardia crassostreae]|uniref:TetR/AcrR family transcriptional regulator n=1 Tax=Nocardia crassostreae TaxID=53428 RepID=UPI0008353CE8|nr:TetR/AcrR family transcriptional regulator [Nocardia crassostreae]